MKKLFALLLALLLCLSMVACGGTKNPDHEYVLSLMERGDYDMAITVLEKLRDDAGGAPKDTAEAPTEAPAEAPAEAPTEAPTEAPAEAPAEEPRQESDASDQQIVTDMVNRFMEDKGNAFMEAYENITAGKAGKVTVLNAMEYYLSNWDSFPTHLMLVSLDIDVCYDDIIYDQMTLALDLDSNTLYDSSMFHNNIPSPAVTKDHVCLTATNAYISHLMFGTDFMWAEHETRRELSEADLAAINASLN